MNKCNSEHQQHYAPSGNDKPMITTVINKNAISLKSSIPVTTTYPGSAALWIQVSPALELAGGMPEV